MFDIPEMLSLSTLICTRFPSATVRKFDPTTTGSAGRLTIDLSFLLFGGGGLIVADPEEGVENILDTPDPEAIDQPLLVMCHQPYG